VKRPDAAVRGARRARANAALARMRAARDRAESTAARMRTVAEAAGLVMRVDSLPALHTVLAEVCARVFTFDRFAAVAGEPVGAAAEPVPWHPLGDSDPELAAAVLAEAAAGLATRRLIHAPPTAGCPDGATTLVVPVVGTHTVLGFLALRVERADALDAADAEVLEALAALAATAIHNLVLLGELRYSREAYAYQALHDPLTGLPNRARLREHLAQVLGGPHADRVAVLLLDLDGFKRVNDSLGHPAGDALLVQVAERLLNATRGSDTIARLGGDEFAILLENVRTPNEVSRVADRVLAAVSAPFVLDGADAVVGTSIGITFGAQVADVAPDGGPVDVDALSDTLLRDADLAMYRAKAAGKGRYVFFDPSMYAEAVSRLEREADLRTALERGEFRLFYQPIVALDTGTAVGVEALVRWQHPLRGMVAPAEFIPLAEEIGLIIPLGRWVLGEACRQARDWAAAGWGTDLTVTVNVSGLQLYDPGFVDEVGAALAAFEIAPHRLVLELTETVMVDRPALALDRFTALKRLGVRLAIDDFGTGYSALSYLRQFPFDVLKIDKSFVDEVAGGGQPAALAAAIVALGEAFALRTVAEGVESAEQAAALGVLGCAVAQGYHFSRPLAASAVTAWLAEGRAGAGLLSSPDGRAPRRDRPAPTDAPRPPAERPGALPMQPAG
jgi:diguanylate cyclase (GGDEF)-like protein